MSVALLASYFVLVLLQVFFRYVLNESLFWAEELVRGAMLWGIMLSSALVAASRGHIRVEVLELMLPPAGRRVVVWAGQRADPRLQPHAAVGRHPIHRPHLDAAIAGAGRAQMDGLPGDSGRRGARVAVDDPDLEPRCRRRRN